jgi:hypothetical protein
MFSNFKVVYLTAKEASFDMKTNDTFELNVKTEIWQFEEFARLQIRQASMPTLSGYQAILWHQVTSDVLVH